MRRGGRSGPKRLPPTGTSAEVSPDAWHAIVRLTTSFAPGSSSSDPLSRLPIARSAGHRGSDCLACCSDPMPPASFCSATQPTGTPASSRGLLGCVPACFHSAPLARGRTHRERKMVQDHPPAERPPRGGPTLSIQSPSAPYSSTLSSPAHQPSRRKRQPAVNTDRDIDDGALRRRHLECRVLSTETEPHRKASDAPKEPPPASSPKLELGNERAMPLWLSPRGRLGGRAVAAPSSTTPNHSGSWDPPGGRRGRSTVSASTTY